MLKQVLLAAAGASIAMASVVPIAAIAQTPYALGPHAVAVSATNPCPNEATAKGLKGKPRKKFIAQCRKGQRRP